MEQQTIDKAIKDVLKNKLDFISYLKIINEIGITGYKVYVAGHTVVYRKKDGTSLKKKMPLAHVDVTGSFNEKAIKVALDDIRFRKIDYQGFLDRMAKAGVANYDVDIKERRTLYSGAGKSYSDPFPPQVRF